MLLNRSHYSRAFCLTEKEFNSDLDFYSCWNYDCLLIFYIPVLSYSWYKMSAEEVRSSGGRFPPGCHTPKASHINPSPHHPLLWSVIVHTLSSFIFICSSSSESASSSAAATIIKYKAITNLKSIFQFCGAVSEDSTVWLRSPKHQPEIDSIPTPKGLCLPLSMWAY